MEAVAEKLCPRWFLIDDAVSGFIMAECVESLNCRIESRLLYIHYCQWCRAQKQRPVKPVTFSRNMKWLGFNAAMVHNGESYWFGLDFRSKASAAEKGETDPLKLHLDSREAFAEADQAEEELRRLLSVHRLTLHPGARQAAARCLAALDRVDQLGVLAREVGVQL